MTHPSELVSRFTLLEFIRRYTDRMGYAPTRKEIAFAVARSLPWVDQQLASLVEDGVIQRDPSRARAIRIVEDDGGLTIDFPGRKS